MTTNYLRAVAVADIKRRAVQAEVEVIACRDAGNDERAEEFVTLAAALWQAARNLEGAAP